MGPNQTAMGRPPWCTTCRVDRCENFLPEEEGKKEEEEEEEEEVKGGGGGRNSYGPQRRMSRRNL